VDIANIGLGHKEIRLTDVELRIISNCMNEACNGLSISDFEIRVGAERDEAQGMLDKLLSALGE
jgi:hypothetical protein